MSNYRRSIDGHTFFQNHQSHFNPEYLDENQSYEIRDSLPHGNTTDSYKDEIQCDNQFNLPSSHPLPPLSQRRNLQNDRLIPLKLGQSATMYRQKSSNCEDAAAFSFMKQPKQSPVSSGAKSVLLLSTDEWKSVIVEVKLLFLNGNYKECATRCRLLLKGIHDSLHVDLTYRLYLASLLTSSLEMIAFPLSNTTSTKLSLYQEALACYKSAAADVKYALFYTDSKICASENSRVYSQSSSARSSVDSVFSHYSRSSSIASESPSFEEKSRYSVTKGFENLEPRRKKKVSFSLSPGDQLKHSPGYDDVTQQNSPVFLDYSFPIPPKTQVTSLRKMTSLEPAPLNLPGARSVNSDFKLKYSISNKLSHLLNYQNLLWDFYSQFEARITEINSIIDKIIGSNGNFQNISQSKETSNEQVKYAGLRRQRNCFDGSRYQALCERVLDEL